jgi:hypothetical protein
VAAWPEENASAAAFLTELDILIARLDTASADAETTATGLDRIVNALQTAKREIEPLWEQYKDKSDDLVPRWFDNAEDELDEQAQRAMITAEKAVSDSVPMLKVPEPYTLTAEDPRVDEKRQLTDNSGAAAVGAAAGAAVGGISVPVPHDPVPPLPGRDPIAPEGPAPAGAGGSGGAVVGSGPDLAGVITPAPPTTLPGGGITGPLPGGGAPLPVPVGGGGVTPPVPGLLPIGRGSTGAGLLPVAPGGSGRGGRPAGLRPSTGGVIGDRSGLGQPGVSGGRAAGPLGGAGPIGRAGAGAPIGGVGGPLGGRGAAGARGGASSGGAVGGRGAAGVRGGGGAVGGPGLAGGPLGGTGFGGAGGVGGRANASRGRRNRLDQAERNGATPAPRPDWLPDDPVGPDRHAFAPGMPGAAQGGRRAGVDHERTVFDPDNPWQVAEGVRPVIVPGPDNDRHDPGPNVIGWRG